MRVYIASVFADKDRVRARCIELNEAGIEITSRWANEEAPANSKATDKSFTYMRQTATMDLDDIMAADVLVLTSPTDADLVAVHAWNDLSATITVSDRSEYETADGGKTWRQRRR